MPAGKKKGKLGERPSRKSRFGTRIFTFGLLGERKSKEGGISPKMPQKKKAYPEKEEVNNIVRKLARLTQSIALSAGSKRQAR